MLNNSELKYSLDSEVFNSKSMKFKDEVFEDKWIIHAVKSVKHIYMVSLLMIPLTQAGSIFIHKWTDEQNLDVFSSMTIVILYILRNVVYLILVLFFYRTYYSQEAKNAFMLISRDIIGNTESWERKRLIQSNARTFKLLTYF